MTLRIHEEASCAILRELGESIGIMPEGMVEHLKGIPRDVVTIAERDPTTLEGYENFLTALMGPPWSLHAHDYVARGATLGPGARPQWLRRVNGSSRNRAVARSATLPPDRSKGDA